MYEELCWINSFIGSGAYKPNWGQRYFAELVNPVPRTLWPDKPMIGLDYAVVRGQAYQEDGTVTATVSTGMIGQGVVNFGRVLGPIFAAFLMSLWAAVLARLDLCGQKIGRIPLFALGLILTFNLGRDITLLTLYTFTFGAAIVWWLEKRGRGQFAQPDLDAIQPRVRLSRFERRQAAKLARRNGQSQPQPAVTLTSPVIGGTKTGPSD